jgi:dTDP-4-amino-4,6-dideoxygalactose transaminase
VGVLSFGGSKLTAAGRGGALLTQNPQIMERIRRHVLRGNDLSPLSELQAAVLIPQWQALDARNAHRAARVRELFEALEVVPLRMVTNLEYQLESGYYKVGFEYAQEPLHPLARELFCRAMRAEGIALFPGFRCLHRIHASRRFRTARELIVADEVDEAVVVLHHPVLLGTQADMLEIGAAAQKVANHAAEIHERAADLPPESLLEHE